MSKDLKMLRERIAEIHAILDKTFSLAVSVGERLDAHEEGRE